jgi:choline kinase
MKIIITAAGLGSRFTKEGIAKPKYEIIAKGKSLFYLSIISLKKYFDDEFIFIFNIRSFNSEFIKRELYFLGIRKYQIILIDYLTSGQACTAFLAEKYVSPDEGVIIFNIDTHIDPEALEEMDLDNCDGLIPVFKVEGEH